MVRRILAVKYRPKPDSDGPSWLTALGQAKDSLWSVDLFRCESAVLRAYWGLVVMDQCTRRIVGFGVPVVRSMEWACAACSTGQSLVRLRRPTSARTMIGCMSLTDGRRTFGSST